MRPLLDAGLREGDGAHHRRRDHREPAAHSARRLRRGDRSGGAGRCRRSSRCCSARGDIATDEMFRAFNMGIGLIVVSREPPIASSDRRAARAVRRAETPSRHRRHGRRRAASVRYSNLLVNRRLARPRSPAAAATCSRSSTRSRSARLDATIAVVISNRAEAAGLIARARGRHRSDLSSSRRDYPNATPTIARSPSVLSARDVGLVCLAGFMRLVGAPLLEAFPESHPQHPPSLLPAFPGSTRSGRRSSTACASAARPCIW